MPTASIDRALAPAAVAVIGASDRPGSRGYHVWRAVCASPGLASVYPVNPKYKYVGDARCYPFAAQIPGRIDLAVIAVKPASAPAALKSLAAKRPAFILFAPQAEGLLSDKSEIAALLTEAHRIGARVIGPNSIGVMSAARGVNASYWPQLPKPGGAALIAQSGLVATALLERASESGIGFSGVVDAGLELDIGMAEWIDWFAADRSTRLIALQVEALPQPRAFFSALRAAAREKPVVVLRAGPEGGYAADRVAASRFSTDAGQDDAFDALCRAAGALRVRTFSAFAAAVDAFACGRLPQGPNVAVISNGTGFAALAADAASRAGLRLAGFSNAAAKALHALAPRERMPGNPLVVGPAASPERIEASLNAALADPGVDSALVIVAPSPMTAFIPAMEKLAAASMRTFKPIAAAWASDAATPAAKRALSSHPEARLAAIRSPEAAAEALGLLARQAAAAADRREPPAVMRQRLSPEALAEIRALLRSALVARRHRLRAAETAKLLSLAGLPPVPHRLARSLEEALTAAEALGWPVALKASAAGLGRRTESGLVFLDLADAAALERAWRSLTENLTRGSPLATPEGVLVEKMTPHPPERELRLGIRRDAVLGPVIEYAAAGIAGTLYGDAAAALPPLGINEARRLAGSLRANRMLEGFRGQPPANRLLLALALCRLSDLAEAVPAILSLKLEPVVPFEDRLVVLSAEASLYDAPLEPDAAHSHLTARRAPAAEPVECAPRARTAAKKSPGEPEEEGRRKGKKQDAEPGTAPERFFLRPIFEEDFERMKRFIGSLSERSRYLRFHTAAPLSEARIAALCRPEWGREGAWAAVEAKSGAEASAAFSSPIAAVARWRRTGREAEAEFGIVVRDDCQRLGLARTLMARLEEEAAEEGCRTLAGYVISGNEAMEAMMRALGYAIEKNPPEMGPEVHRWAKALDGGSRPRG